MALQKLDIIAQFGAIGHWLSAHHLTADIVVDGGAALVLQTDFRKAAADIDIYFMSVTDRNRNPFNLHRQLELLYKMAKHFPAIDGDYAGWAFGETVSRRLRERQDAPAGQESDPWCSGIHAPLNEAEDEDPNFSVPHSSYFDAEGYGARFRLITLAQIFQNKMDRVGLCERIEDKKIVPKQADYDDIAAIRPILLMGHKPQQQEEPRRTTLDRPARLPNLQRAVPR